MPAQIFAQETRLREMGLDTPPVTQALERLAHAGLITGLTGTVYRVEDAIHLLGEGAHAEL